MRFGQMTVVWLLVLLPGTFLMLVVVLSNPGPTPKTVSNDVQESQQLIASDGARMDRLGVSVALDGDLALAGAPSSDNPFLDTGAVYAFHRDAKNNWTAMGKLLPFEVTEGEMFGSSVALSGVTAVIGAPENGEHGESSGAAYVFQFDRGAWRQTTTLTASDGHADGWFGQAVAVSGDLVVVGSPGKARGLNYSGAAYVFQKIQAGNWYEIARLAPADIDGLKDFGCCVAVEGGRVVVGASAIGSTSECAGAVYVFERDCNGSWRQDAKLTTENANANSLFGRSIAVSGNTIIAGAAGDSGRQFYAGAAYIFRCTGERSWCQVGKLTATDAAAKDRFGWSVALSGDTAIVGALRRNTAGAVYAFRTDGYGTLKHVDTFAARSAQGADQLSSSVALSGDTVLAGAPQYFGAESDSGAAYAFQLRAPVGRRGSALNDADRR